MPPVVGSFLHNVAVPVVHCYHCWAGVALCVCVGGGGGGGGSICSTSWHALLWFFKAKEKVKRPKSKGAFGVPGVAPLVGVTWTSVGMHGNDGGCRDE